MSFDVFSGVFQRIVTFQVDVHLNLRWHFQRMLTVVSSGVQSLAPILEGLHVTVEVVLGAAGSVTPGQYFWLSLLTRRSLVESGWSATYIYIYIYI